MMSIRCLFPILLLLLLGFPAKAAARERPNVIFILTDNHGAWTLGCYGNPDVKTPHIDRMAAEGVLFTRAFANNAVCSPTRATFLTGLTPSQHGVHRYLGQGGAQTGPGAYDTLEEFTTLPEVFREAGYACGLSGKWHLGNNHVPQEGFTLWVTKPHGHSTGFIGQEIIENGETRVEPGYLTDYWTERGIAFIEENKDRPFFLYLAYNGPYTLGDAMLEDVPSPYIDPYVENPMVSFPRPESPHPWQRTHFQLINNIDAFRNLAGQISAVDAGVGKVLATLKKLGLDEDTLVVFAADQGAVAGQNGFWGMGDHTRPLHAYDGTMHIPFIFRHPGKIHAGVRSERIVTNYDFMPSLLGYLGMSMPAETNSPGRDFSPVLRGEKLPDWEDVVYYEFENVRSVRTADWKYVERRGEEPNELFDLRADPNELENLYGRAETAEIQSRLREKMSSWFERYADPKWDLWKNGSSKSGLITYKQLGFESQIVEGQK